MKNTLPQELSPLGITLTDAQLSAFTTYYEMLIAHNKSVNLTRVTDIAGVAKKHFADSLAISGLIPESARVIDVGTGAGFPGLPLAVIRADITVTLLDSLQKRVDFLADIIAAIGLPNAAAVHGRAEDYAHMREHRETYDAAVSRAVASMPVLCEYCLPFVKTGGVMIACKGENGAFEDCGAAARALGGGDVSRVTLNVPGLAHYAVMIHKTAATPEKYPRKAGTPGKNPL